jgi:hypothetical protein
MSNFTFEHFIDNSDNEDELYEFDLKKFRENMCDESDMFESSELVGKIIKSFNTESFNFYFMLKSLEYYQQKYKSLKSYFEYSWYYILKAFLITEENVEEDSEQMIKLNKKMDELWDSIPGDLSIKSEP